MSSDGLFRHFNTYADIDRKRYVGYCLEFIIPEKNPSWLYSIDNGATTIWERWNSYMLDQGMGPRGMNSFNHYAYGVVCEWIWETAAGISSDPVNPGFKHIIMKPIPDKRLGSIEAVYNSVSGTIKVHGDMKVINGYGNFQFQMVALLL